MPASAPCASALSSKPVLVGLNEACTIKTNTAPQAIERGVRVALEEINAEIGVLGGRAGPAADHHRQTGLGGLGPAGTTLSKWPCSPAWWPSWETNSAP